MIKAQIVADSVTSAGQRLTTFVLTYPRMIHAELMTHRVFSRNASSSRAIPVKKSIQMVIDDPVIPLHFTRNKAGMQGGDALTGEEGTKAREAWLEGRDRAVEVAQKLADLEVHKQYANRVLEPYAHITVVLTSTTFSNWFALRVSKMAQPEIQHLAVLMYEAYSLGTPVEIADGRYHLPFITPNDAVDELGRAAPVELLIKRSVARCARVSYLNHDGTQSTVEQDVALHDRLVSAAPLHASPAEHQAMAVGDPNVKSGNFQGWVQYRKTLRDENVVEFVWPEDL